MNKEDKQLLLLVLERETNEVTKQMELTSVNGTIMVNNRSDGLYVWGWIAPNMQGWIAEEQVTTDMRLVTKVTQADVEHWMKYYESKNYKEADDVNVSPMAVLDFLERRKGKLVLLANEIHDLD